jgi:hypothetical protein
MRIEERLRRLEKNQPPDKCPRCSGIFVIRVNGKFYSASRDGVPISEEEYRRHEAEHGPHGECPVCGRVPGPPIRVLGLEQNQVLGLERTQARARHERVRTSPGSS